MAETTGMPAPEIFEFIESNLAAWLTEQEGTLVEIEITALAPLIERVAWLTLPDGPKKSVSLPSKIGLATSDLRPAQADPERGAWVTARLWMDATDKTLQHPHGLDGRTNLAHHTTLRSRLPQRTTDLPPHPRQHPRLARHPSQTSSRRPRHPSTRTPRRAG